MSREETSFIGISSQDGIIPSKRIDMQELKRQIKSDVEDKNTSLSKIVDGKLKYEIKSIPVDKLRFSNGESYNRDIQESRVKGYLAKYDESLIGVLRVSLRDDGFCYIIDGQHRALLSSKAGEEFVFCQVFYGLTIQQESDMFVKLSKNQIRISALDTFRAELVDTGSIAYRINVLLNSLDIQVIFNIKGRTKTPNRVACVGAIRDTYKSLGEVEFVRTMRLVKETWDGCSSSYDQRIIMGMKIFMKTFGKELNDKTFRHKLSKKTPENIFAGGKALNNYVSDNGFTLYALEILQTYNRGIRNVIDRLDVNKLLK